MTSYIATFFTHYDAICFVKMLRGKGISAQLSPVPRRLSSSCGTCVRFEAAINPQELPHEGIEQLVSCIGDTYTKLFIRE